MESVYKVLEESFKAKNTRAFRANLDIDLDGKKESIIKLERSDLIRCVNGPDQHGPDQFFHDPESPSYEDPASDLYLAHGRLGIFRNVPYFISFYDNPKSLHIDRVNMGFAGTKNPFILETICTETF